VKFHGQDCGAQTASWTESRNQTCRFSDMADIDRTINILTKLETDMPEGSSTPTTSETPVYNAEDLTAGGNLAQIRLSEAVYTLRITRQGKLILTK
jgi:hemin uptake protein HemP